MVFEAGQRHAVAVRNHVADQAWRARTRMVGFEVQHAGASQLFAAGAPVEVARELIAAAHCQEHDPHVNGTPAL
jgi:hypothetical protein